MRIIGLILLSLLFISGCAPSKPKPAEKELRPSLMVRPNIRMMQTPKYKLKLGVLTMRDQRLSNFYGESDNFFREKVVEGLSQSVYLALKRSYIFEQTKRINIDMPDKMTRSSLRKIAKDNNVDVLFVGDIVIFNLLRKSLIDGDALELKMGGQSDADVAANDFQLSVNYQIIGQLIIANNGAILWAEKVKRKKTVLGKDGTLSVNRLGMISQEVVKDTMVDMATLIKTTAAGLK